MSKYTEGPWRFSSTGPVMKNDYSQPFAIYQSGSTRLDRLERAVHRLPTWASLPEGRGQGDAIAESRSGPSQTLPLSDQKK